VLLEVTVINVRSNGDSVRNAHNDEENAGISVKDESDECYPAGDSVRNAGDSVKMLK
jgi:hypothetical protein